MKVKIELPGLTYSENKKYQAAIRRGYFEGYTKDPRAWKRSFVGAFITKFPNRTPILDMLRGLCGHVPQWEDLTDALLRDFADVLGHRYSLNTRHNRLGEVRAVLNSYDGEAPIPSAKFTRILRSKTEPSESVYLTLDELTRIIHYVPETNPERYVQKMFIIESFTGARNCDSVDLSIANCNLETGMLHYVSKKTKKDVVLPIWAPVIPFLNNDIKAEPVTLPTFNAVLRDICRKCGVNSLVSIYRRGERTVGEKWRYVSSHTGRRSYATNLYINDCDPCNIAEWMGHSTPDITMRRYIIGHRDVSDKSRHFFRQQL